MLKTTTVECLKNLFVSEADAIKQQLQFFDPDQYSKAIDAIFQSRLVITSGCGNAGIAAKKFAHILCCVEQPAKFMSPSEALHGGSGCIQQGDVLVLFTRGGKTAELYPIIDIAKQRKAIIISVIENLESPIAKASDILLRFSILREADRDSIMATCSYVAMTAVTDAIIIGIIEESDYSKNQFSVIHPGGAVGSRLRHETAS